MSEVTNISQSLQYCQNMLDLAKERFSDLVKNAVCENNDEQKMELLTFITNVNKTFQNFTETLFEEPKVNDLKKRSLESSDQVPEKKLKLSPSPLMNLPNEIWMKILSYLPTHDILKNFNLTCKKFHSLAINPSTIKSLKLKLENIKESAQYQEIVKVLTRSKALNELVIRGSGHGRMNHVISHALKANRLKILDVSSDKATFSKKNLDYMKTSNIEVLRLDEIILEDEAMQQIGSMKTLKSVKISNNSWNQDSKDISELIKTFVDTEIELEELAVVSLQNKIIIKASTFGKFLKERAKTLKKLKIQCSILNDFDDGEDGMDWNATSNLEELYYEDRAQDLYNDNQNQRRRPIKIEFGLEMPKLTKLVIRNINWDMQNIITPQNFPILERLYLERRHGDANVPKVTQQTLANILENCPNLKSVKLVGLNFRLFSSTGDIWRAFLCQMYKTFNVYIDIFSYSLHDPFEEELKENDLATFYKYTKLKVDYLDWKKEQPRYEFH